ncbi:hypothetical protein DFH28DRAFT_439655 [Melampsora americana]|nr:hypothetical protein DFH28DRAFT_439655 [Melampsora americana]
MMSGSVWRKFARLSVNIESSLQTTYHCFSTCHILNYSHQALLVLSPVSVKLICSCRLLKSVGSNLEKLDIRQDKLSRDKILSDGLRTYCRKIRRLNLGELQELTPKGVKDSFDMWNELNASKLET